MLVETDSVEVDKDLARDLQTMVEDSSNASSIKEEFKCIFWEQQACVCLY